jgi:hypothetical protein
MMTVTKERFVRGDRVVTVVTTDESRVVDWNDIDVCIESDDWTGETPWENCDGWEHEFDREGWNDHPDRAKSRGRVNRSARDGGPGYIIIEDDTVRGWGVPEDRIAEVKRKALDQLVDWYENGWEVWQVTAEYGDFSDSIGGVYEDAGCSDHAEQVGEELRAEVAAQLEDAGYIVEGRP